MYDKNIQYDRATKDYRMELDGRCVGFRATYSQAEHALNDLVSDMLMDGDFASAAELDGGAVECSEPDNLCSVHNPCPAHAADAARYLADQTMIPLLDDCYFVITMALGRMDGARSVVSELQRLKTRLEAAAVCDAARMEGLRR